MHTTVTEPPPERPELPEGVDPEPRWPAWYALAGFGVGLVATFVATLMQSLAFVGSAVLFASFTAKPEARHFGLRRAPFWPTVGWAALGLASFYAFSGVYALTVDPDTEQTITQQLGADEGTLGMVVAGFMVI